MAKKAVLKISGLAQGLRISKVRGQSSPEPKPTLYSQRTEFREVGTIPKVTQHRARALTPSLSNVFPVISH